MIVTYNWLKEFIDFDFSVEELAHKITMLGLEVDGIEKKDDDYIIEIDLTPNKADSLSVYGVAREISLLVDSSLKTIEPDLSSCSGSSMKPSITIDDADLCPRYSSLIIENVKVADSPDYIQKKLEACGVRPINNIVDATNYVLLEMGQPLHSFDFDLLAEKKIIVRRAKDGEKLQTLDDQEKALTPNNLVIADAQKAVALAGVMGGANSEINADSKNVLLESAYFSPLSIRKTARQLGYHTEASHRFERGTDYNLTVKAMLRTAELIIQQNPDAKVSDVVDIYPKKLEPVQIDYRNSRYEKIIGVPVDFSQAVSILKKVGLDIQEIDEKNQTLKCLAPSYRPDLKLEIDLIEEVARVVGYENVPAIIPSISPISNALYDSFNQEFNVSNFVRSFLIENGLKEIINYTFESSEFNEKLGIPIGKTLKMSNPLDSNQNILRPSLLQGMLKNLQHNYKFQNKDLSVFELGNVFSLDKETMVQKQRLGFLLTGKKNSSHFTDSDNFYDFFDLKGLFEALLKYFNLEEVAFEKGEIPFLHKGRTALVLDKEQEIGFLGQLSYYKSDWLEFDIPVFLGEIDLSYLIGKNIKPTVFDSFKNINTVRRDLAILVPESVPYDKIVSDLRKYDFVVSVILKDQYRGDKIETGFISYTFGLELKSIDDKQLRDEDINELLNSLLVSLEKQVKAKLR